MWPSNPIKDQRLIQRILNELNKLPIKLSEDDKRRICDIARGDISKFISKFRPNRNIDQNTLQKAIVSAAAEVLGTKVASGIAKELGISQFDVNDFRTYIGKSPIKFPIRTAYERATSFYEDADDKDAARAAALAAVEIYEKYRDKVLQVTGSAPSALLSALLRRIDYLCARELYRDGRPKKIWGGPYSQVLSALRITDDMIRDAFEKYYRKKA